MLGRRIFAAAVLCGAMLAAGGCTSNIYEGVGPATTVPALSGSSPQNTGTYPNLNIRPQAAATSAAGSEPAEPSAGMTLFQASPKGPQ